MLPLDIGTHSIGPGHPTFIIAEAGVNHNGDPRMARQLIDTARRAGADAVKFQTFKAEKVVTASAPKAEYQKAATGSSESQLEMVRKFELSYADFEGLSDYCREVGILFLSTPFDQESADFLDSLGMPLIKIPSGELTNHPFLAHLAAKGKPLVLSTGMAELEEVARALEVIRAAGDPPVVLLQCVSNYPADPKDVNLRAMVTMAKQFGVLAGYSDHTLGLEVALAAVALGASVLEKHFTLDRSLPGPDHLASLAPEDLTRMVASVRIVESSLGTGTKSPAPSEANTASVARRSLVAACDLPAGQPLTRDMVAILRPGTGLGPSSLEQILGRVIVRPIAAGTLLDLSMLQ